MKYNVLDTITTIDKDWDIRESTLNGSWKTLWRESLHNFWGLANAKNEVNALVTLAQHSG